MEDALCYSNSQLDILFAREQTWRIARGNPSADQDVVAEHSATMVYDREKVRGAEKAMVARVFTPLFPAQECPQFVEGYFSACFVAPDNIVFEV